MEQPRRPGTARAARSPRVGDHNSATPTRWPSVEYEEHGWVSSLDIPRRWQSTFSGPYRAAVVPEIAGLDTTLRAATAALADEATAELARFDAEMGSEIAPVGSILLRSESAASSRIEHLTASAKAVALAEMGDTSRRNASEIVANTAAMRAAIALSDRLDAPAILAMHAALLEHDPKLAGKWRDAQVWIGSSSYGPHTASFVPPHHTRVPAAIDDLVNFMKRDDLAVLPQAAIAHAQFETIHPFPDGNGRTGRAIVHCQLRGKRLTRQVTVPVSAGLLTDTDRYFDALTAYRAGDIHPIVERFAEASFDSVINGRELVADLCAVRTAWSDAIKRRRQATVWRALDIVFQHPVLDNALVQRELDVSVMGAEAAITELVEIGALEEITGGRRNRRYASTRVLSALDAFADRAGCRRREPARLEVGPLDPPSCAGRGAAARVDEVRVRGVCGHRVSGAGTRDRRRLRVNAATPRCHAGPMADSDHLLDSLRLLTGRPTADFRDGQREAIEALVNDRARVLVVQRTGWGKSAVYFLTTHLLRRQGLGPTLLISPLLALMRNQIEAAARLGLRCETINSASDTTIAELERVLRRDEVDLLLISPERLANPEFGDKIMPLVGSRPGLIVIDEVHCISDWGHDFRPDYRRIGRIVDRLAGSSVPILGCTATANDRVVADVADQLGAELTTFRGPLRRDGLALSTIRLDRQAERLVWLAETIPQLEGSGIVYCLTVRDVENVAAWLKTQRIAVEPYFGSLDNALRLDAELKLQTNQIKALVATTALGMGYDKPDLSFVIHFQSPGSPVAYYQQVGRAGRALDQSRGILLRGLEDEQIQDYFIERAFAVEHLVNDIVRAFDSFDGPVPLIRIQNKVNVKIGVLELVVKQLDVDGVLERVAGTSYQRTLQPWSYPARRIEQVTAARRLEQQSMVDYFHTTECRMRFIANLLDDHSAGDCGICDNCAGEAVASALPVERIAEAERFLRKRPIPLATKRMYFDADRGARRKIPVGELVDDGRVLSIWGDAGWGQLVPEGKLITGSFDDRLVDALAELIEEWSPEPSPQWVTSVPSFRHPELVPQLAERLAARLGWPYRPAVTKLVERPAQNVQQNAAHQQRNVEGAFVVTGEVPDGPVLLIDDIVDSTWTLTEVGRVLRRAGAPLVYPVALASSAGRD